jgi:hypothetical protein
MRIKPVSIMNQSVILSYLAHRQEMRLDRQRKKAIEKLREDHNLGEFKTDKPNKVDVRA